MFAPGYGAARASVGFSRPENADRVDHCERQVDGAKHTVVQDELCQRGAAARKRLKQLKPPVVFIRREDLPATFVVIPEAPDPILFAELRRPQSRARMQGDNVVALLRRVADLMPDRFRILITVGDVGEVVGEVEDRFAARHLGPAVRFGRVGSPRV